MTCGEKIQKLRKDRGYTQEDLADILSVSRQSVSRWESDIAFPETDKLITLAKLFKCSIDYLLNDENNEYKEIKKEKTLNVKRFLLPIICITLGLLTIGLFFVGCLSVDANIGNLEGKIIFNYYKIAFFGVEAEKYSPFINIMSLLAFLSIIGLILCSIFLMIFNFKALGIALNYLVIAIPTFIMSSIVLLDSRINAIPWILSTLFVTLSLISVFVVQLNYISEKQIIMPIFSLMYSYLTFVYAIAKGFLLNGIDSVMSALLLLFLVASTVLSVLLIIKKNKHFEAGLIFVNLLFTILCVIKYDLTLYSPWLVFTFIFILMTSKWNNTSKLLEKVSLFTFLIVCLFDTWLDYKVKRIYTSFHGEIKSFDSSTSFYSLATFQKDIEFAPVQVIVFIAFVLGIAAIVFSIIGLFIENKYSSSTLSVLNILVPVMVLISVIMSGNTSDPRFGLVVAIVFCIFVALIICQFVIKPMRSPLINKLFIRKEVRH